MSNPWEILNRELDTYRTPEELTTAAQELEESVAMSRRFTTEGATQYTFLRLARILRDRAAEMQTASPLP